MGSEEEEVKVEVLRTCMVVPEGGERGRETKRHLFLPGSDSYWRWVPYNGRLLFYANNDKSSNNVEKKNKENLKSNKNDNNNINYCGDIINDDNVDNVDVNNDEDNANNNNNTINTNKNNGDDGGGDDDKDNDKGHQGALNYPLLVASLKSSLARTLVDYYPFAGRLSPSRKDEGRLEILCEGQGVLFVEAFAHTSFKEVQRDDFQIKGFFQALAPAPPASADDDVAFNSPLLCVQSKNSRSIQPIMRREVGVQEDEALTLDCFFRCFCLLLTAPKPHQAKEVGEWGYIIPTSYTPSFFNK